MTNVSQSVAATLGEFLCSSTPLRFAWKHPLNAPITKNRREKPTLPGEWGSYERGFLPVEAPPLWGGGGINDDVIQVLVFFLGNRAQCRRFLHYYPQWIPLAGLALHTHTHTHADTHAYTNLEGCVFTYPPSDPQRRRAKGRSGGWSAAVGGSLWRLAVDERAKRQCSEQPKGQSVGQTRSWRPHVDRTSALSPSPVTYVPSHGGRSRSHWRSAEWARRRSATSTPQWVWLCFVLTASVQLVCFGKKNKKLASVLWFGPHALGVICT